MDVTYWGRLFQVRAAATRKEGRITDGGQPCIRRSRTFGYSEEADRRRLRVLKSAVYSSSSARYDGAVPCRHLYTRTASLNCILSGARSQCCWWRNGVMWSYYYLDEENTSRAPWTALQSRRVTAALLCFLHHSIYYNQWMRSCGGPEPSCRPEDLECSVRRCNIFPV